MQDINRVPGALRPILLVLIFGLILVSILLPSLGGRHYGLLVGMPVLIVFWWSNTTRIPASFRYPMLFALLANFSQDIAALRMVSFQGGNGGVDFYVFIIPFLFTLFSVPGFLIYLFLKMRTTIKPKSKCNFVAVLGFVPVTVLVILTYITPITFSISWLSLLFIVYAIVLYVLFQSVVHAFSIPLSLAGRIAMAAAFVFVILCYKMLFPALEFSVQITGSMLLFLQNVFLAVLVYSTAKYLNSRVIP